MNLYINDIDAYTNYLGNASLPKLLTDDITTLKNRINTEFPDYAIVPSASLHDLKDALITLTEQRKQNKINIEIAKIKDYNQYNDIQDIYDQIESNSLYDAPLMLEWNTWRAMTMLDGGNIVANLNFDDYGLPLSTATGNMPDIVCDYDDYTVCVEVTMSCGQKQYEMEGEPVTRHLGKLKKNSSKPCYCLFIAPRINDACISHFYTLHHVNLAMYGGKLTIIPLPLQVFRKMIEDSYRADYIPDSNQVHKLFEASNDYAKTCSNEIEWYARITETALHWLDEK